MASSSDLAETILIVDDEEPVRRTFREWLEQANLGCHVLTAGDAESALTLANQHSVDLAVLDWNLGAGHDGLQLLEDLTLFNPDVVAIMVTGFANQATPLMAMRMGVRDYLDKNQDLNRETFLAAVEKQLRVIRPARQQKRVTQGLSAFRAAVERILPLVQTAQALHDPVPLPAAISSLFTFLIEAAGASDGVLLVHSHDPARQPPEVCRAYGRNGQMLDVRLVPFARSLGSSVVSMQEPQTLDGPERVASEGLLLLQPFEQGRHSILAAPIQVAPGVQVVLELFDRREPGGAPASFRPADRHLLRAASGFAGELLRQCLAEHQTQRLLFDAVGAALRAGDEFSQALRTAGPANPEDPAPPDVMEQLRTGLRGTSAEEIDADSTVRLAEAIRLLALRHGPPAVEHCVRLVEDLRHLLDEVTGTGEEGRT